MTRLLVSLTLSTVNMMFFYFISGSTPRVDSGNHCSLLNFWFLHPERLVPPITNGKSEQSVTSSLNSKAAIINPHFVKAIIARILAQVWYDDDSVRISSLAAMAYTSKPSQVLESKKKQLYGLVRCSPRSVSINSRRKSQCLIL